MSQPTTSAYNLFRILVAVGVVVPGKCMSCIYLSVIRSIPLCIQNFLRENTKREHKKCAGKYGKRSLGSH